MPTSPDITRSNLPVLLHTVGGQSLGSTSALTDTMPLHAFLENLTGSTENGVSLWGSGPRSPAGRMRNDRLFGPARSCRA